MSFSVKIDARSATIGLILFIILAFIFWGVLSTIADNLGKTGIDVSGIRNSANMLLALGILVLVILLVVVIVKILEV